MRRSAEVTLVAFLFSLLTLQPLGLRAHTTLSGPDFQADFCHATPAGGPVQALPVKPDPSPHAGTHCKDCAGCAGGSAVPAAPIAPCLAVAVTAVIGVVIPAPTIELIDGVVSRPRGPPLSV